MTREGALEFARLMPKLDGERANQQIADVMMSVQAQAIAAIANEASSYRERLAAIQAAAEQVRLEYPLKENAFWHKSLIALLDAIGKPDKPAKPWSEYMASDAGKLEYATQHVAAIRAAAEPVRALAHWPLVPFDRTALAALLDAIGKPEPSADSPTRESGGEKL